MSKRTTFNLEWVDSSLNPQWKGWLRSNKDAQKATCILCSKAFSLSNMGRQAVTSHEKSVKHIKNAKAAATGSVHNFFNKKSSEVSKVPEVSTIAEVPISGIDSKEVSANVAVEVEKKKINFYFSKDDTLKAELIWALKLVMTHSSFNSFTDVSTIFKMMFPDSKLAQNITVGRTKMAYLVTFGLAPFFNQLLLKEIADCAKYVICFDEALNKIAQKGQMDFVIRYWSTSKNRVESRYLTSVFLGHSTAKDLIEKFREGIDGIPTSKLIQVSMDGPTVNHKFFKSLLEEEEEKGNHIFDLGTCELHVVHGAFRTGHTASGWNLNSFFRALHQLFKDSPARRADFIAITETSTFPHKFCQVRWIENVKVADRALELLPQVKKYLESSNLPKTATVEIVSSAVRDILIQAKIAFFSSVASMLETFLTVFQTNCPVAPFLYDATVMILQQLLKRFVRADLILKAATPFKLLQIDLTDTSNYAKLSEVDIGIAASRFIHKNGIKGHEKQLFRKECQAFLIATAKKIIERSPLKFPIVKSISCLNPKLIIANVMISKSRMGRLLQILNEKGHLSALNADKAKQQFDSLCYKVGNDWNKSFVSFSQKMRLDDFYVSLLNKEDNFKEIYDVIKMVLIFSHGNATVESGFSINKDMLVENLHEKSLTGLRTIYDAVKANGGIEAIHISQEMLNHARMARTRYHLALEDKKKDQTDEKKKATMKRKVACEMKLLEKKKAKLASHSNLEIKKIETEIAELAKHL